MLKFFRKIRQKVLNEKILTGRLDGFTKYLVYAIGEIILVVIGILIALQINNWNEQRKQNKLEQDYLIALKKEFENNVKEVDRVINLNQKLLDNASKLAKYTGPGAPKITEEEFGKLFFNAINSEVQYRPGTGVVNEIINSGKLNIFQNKDLKNALAALDGLMLKIRFQEDHELSSTRFDIIYQAKESLGLRRMAYDTYGENFGLDKGRFLDSNLAILNSIKFDNNLMGFIFTSGYLSQRYDELKNQLLKIIDIIDEQIE